MSSKLICLSNLVYLMSETPESGNNPDHLINGGGKNNLGFRSYSLMSFRPSWAAVASHADGLWARHAIFVPSSPKKERLCD